MHLRESDIRHLADLARLHVSDEEAARLSRDLTEIVGFIDAAADDDVSGAEPVERPVESDGKPRRDEAVARDVGRSSGQAADSEGGFVRVPPVRGLRGTVELDEDTDSNE